MYPKPQVLQLREIRLLVIQDPPELHEHIGTGEDLPPELPLVALVLQVGLQVDVDPLPVLEYVLVQHPLEVVEDAPGA